MATPAVNKVRDIDKGNTITVQADHMWGKNIQSNEKVTNSHNIILRTFLKKRKKNKCHR